jgi:hypothetical protein
MILDRLLELLRPPVDTDVKLAGVSMFLGKQLDAYEPRVRSLEARQLQRGEQGPKGPQGDTGKDGKDGRDGTNGKDGRDGKDGKNGKDGKQGVSVVDSWIAADNHLMLSMSDGKEIDAGDLAAIDGHVQQIMSTQLANYQITVSATPPGSPQVNDLWLQI